MGSLFNRPTWAKAHIKNEDKSENVNIFSHSHSFQDIVRDGERRKKERLEHKKERVERKKIKAERRSSGKHQREDEEDDGLLKKRRITLEDGEALLKSVGLSADIVNVDDDSESEDVGPVRRSPRNNRLQRKKHDESPLRSSSRRAEVVEIRDNSDDNDSPGVQRVRTVEPVEENESDDEFAELRRKARLQREQSGHNNHHSGRSNPTAQTSNTGDDPQAQTNYKPSTLEDEPVVYLFIESRIPNTTQLIVQRKLSQRLEEVRAAWCKKQNFPPGFSDNVFFIHRMRRLYNVTTCRSLGLEVDTFGQLTMKGAEGKEGVEKVHLQAVTQEIFDELIAERNLEAKRRSGEPSHENEADAGAEDEHMPREKRYIPVRMVAKNRDDFLLKVKPTTRFSSIAFAYSKSRLDGEQTVRLEFDGDPLEPTDVVQNTEISNGDIIHVYPT